MTSEPVTGGAFCRFDADTAELKRIWTDSRHRRQGHAKALLVELEAEIAARGYRRIYLTTGDRQPEAEALYLSTGYTRLAEPLPAEGEVFRLRFVKDGSHDRASAPRRSRSTGTAGTPRHGGTRRISSP